MTAPELIEEMKALLTEVMDTMDVFMAMYNDKNDMKVDIMMSRKEAAAFVGKSTRQLDRLSEQGRLHRENVDGHLRFRLRELLDAKGVKFNIPDQPAPRSELEALLMRFGKQPKRRKTRKQ